MKCTDSLRIVVVGDTNTIASLACERLAGHDSDHVAGGLGTDYKVHWVNCSGGHCVGAATLHVKALPVQPDLSVQPAPPPVAMCVCCAAGHYRAQAVQAAGMDAPWCVQCQKGNCPRTALLPVGGNATPTHCNNSGTHCYMVIAPPLGAIKSCACLCDTCMPTGDKK